MSFQNLIKRGLITLGIIDDKDFQTAQVSYMGKTKNIQIVHDYGFASNCPTGGIVLMFNVQGQEENCAGIADLPNDRFKNLKAGEVALYNALTESFIILKENNDIDIESKKDLNLNITGKVKINESEGVTGTFTNSITTINGFVTGGT